MKESYTYFVYIMTNKMNTTLYIGVTNDIERRVYEHKKKENKGFTEKYKLNKLVYFDETDDISFALQHEKNLKRWYRKWKERLIERENPLWKDLSEDWYEPSDFQ